MTKQIQTQQQELSFSERFKNAVISKYSETAGSVIQFTEQQKRLITSYFIQVDVALKGAEERRLKKNERFRDPLAVTWQNIDMADLANKVTAFSRIGLDPSLPNHISFVPFKDNTSNKYQMVCIEGYRGLEIKATKYGLDVPDEIIVELVYENDTFKPLKKDLNNDVESYVFEVPEPFDRGEIVGGFYYYLYANEPYKNKLAFFTRAEIEKRKPRNASAEFWGGEKEKWEGGKVVGKEHIEGWYPEMMLKTVARMAYNAITIDGNKVDDAFMNAMEADKDIAMLNETPAEKIMSSANKGIISMEVETVEPVPTPEPKPATKVKAEPKQEEPADDGMLF